MVDSVVLDNSVIVSLLASDEDSAYSERVFRSAQTGTRLVAPALCMFEFGNAVLTLVRRKRMLPGEVWKVHERLEELPIEFKTGMSFSELSAIHGLALESGLSFYDAAYLMLALVRNTQLATLDKALRGTARTQGVKVFE